MREPSAPARRPRRPRWLHAPESLLEAVVLCSLASCGGASSDPGLHALVQVAHAQFVEGAMPEAGTGPAVVAVNALHSIVAPGAVDEQLSGTIAAGGEAVAIGVRDDVGYWVLPASAPDPLGNPSEPTFVADFSISRRAPAGPLTVSVIADDIDKVFGKNATVSLVVQDAPPVEGPLVVSLGWADDADLDLHVTQPDGVVVWWGNINSYQKPVPGQPADDPTAFRSGAVLDFDSNANCVVDARDLEDVVWPVEPAKGKYEVRVDTSSLCDTPDAPWWVSVRLHDVVIASARGTAVADDTRGAHDEGSGVLALSFEVK